jgi:hypothetical protein
MLSWNWLMTLQTAQNRPQIQYKTPRPVLDLVCEALIAEHGLISPAAKRLNMDNSNLHKYIKAHAKAQAALRTARERMGDYAEGKLFRLIEQGSQRAIEFYLAAVHRRRGYGLPAGAAVNVGDAVTNSMLVIQHVTIVPVPSGTQLSSMDSAACYDPRLTIEHEEDDVDPHL